MDDFLPPVLAQQNVVLGKFVENKAASVEVSARVVSESDLLQWQPLSLASHGQGYLTAAAGHDFHYSVTDPVNTLGVDELLTCTAIPQGVGFLLRATWETDAQITAEKIARTRVKFTNTSLCGRFSLWLRFGLPFLHPITSLPHVIAALVRTH